MKYLLSILVQTLAFVIVTPFVTIVCLWDLNFAPVRGLRRDYLETVSFPIYRMLGYKTKHYPRNNRF